MTTNTYMATVYIRLSLQLALKTPSNWISRRAVGRLFHNTAGVAYMNDLPSNAGRIFSWGASKKRLLFVREEHELFNLLYSYRQPVKLINDWRWVRILVYIHCKSATAFWKSCNSDICAWFGRPWVIKAWTAILRRRRGKRLAQAAMKLFNQKYDHEHFK